MFASSTSIDRRCKDVRVLSIIISELKLGDIERHIFAAHFVERADHAALENRPDGLITGIFEYSPGVSDRLAFTEIISLSHSTF
jgi:hypothetical protein